MFFKSIRFKVLLWYVLFLTITLSAFSVMLYEGFNHFIYNNLDDLLCSRAEGVASSINTYWSAKIGAEAFTAIARDWVEEKKKDPELMSMFVQILDPDGNIIISSKAMPRIEQLDKDDFKDILKGEDSFDSVNGETLDHQHIKFRLYSKPVTLNGKVEYVVQVAAPVNLLSIALGNLKLILFLLLPLTVLLAALPGVLLVNLTLRPVDSMTKTLKQITAENLKLKIHIPDTKDEIKRLADTFNEMIERLNRSFSSQQRFIKDISRELQIPLAGLKEELESALAKSCGEAEYKSLLVKALKETDGFSRTIENLSILSRFNEERPILEIRRINLTGLVERVFKEMKALAAEKEISTSLSCIETITIDGDKEQLTQLFANLLENAIKYTHRKGNVSVTVRKEGKNSARVSIIDTGIGIPEDELPYIFDRFYQVAKPRGIKGGFGLGLSTVKSTVEAHKGAVTVESHEGEGSTFTVSLPITYPG